MVVHIDNDGPVTHHHNSHLPNRSEHYFEYRVLYRGKLKKLQKTHKKFKKQNFLSLFIKENTVNLIKLKVTSFNHYCQCAQEVVLLVHYIVQISLIL